MAAAHLVVCGDPDALIPRFLSLHPRVSTIMEAVELAGLSAATIHIMPGQYSESVVIDSASLHLVGYDHCSGAPVSPIMLNCAAVFAAHAALELDHSRLARQKWRELFNCVGARSGSPGVVILCQTHALALRVRNCSAHFSGLSLLQEAFVGWNTVELENWDGVMEDCAVSSIDSTSCGSQIALSGGVNHVLHCSVRSIELRRSTCTTISHSLISGWERSGDVLEGLVTVKGSSFAHLQDCELSRSQAHALRVERGAACLAERCIIAGCRGIVSLGGLQLVDCECLDSSSAGLDASGQSCTLYRCKFCAKPWTRCAHSNRKVQRLSSRVQ
jgi:hypothetical protein